MINKYIAFLFGILVKIVDDINDFNIFNKYKLFYETILILLTIYILFFNKGLSPIASCIFGIGGLIAYVFIPHAVDAIIWKLIILLSIPGCIYFIPQFIEFLPYQNKTDIQNLSYFVLPLLIFSVIFSIIEDIIVPDEYGNKKLIDKMFQSILMILFLFSIDYIDRGINLNDKHKQALVWCAYGWLGYALTSVIILYFFIN